MLVARSAMRAACGPASHNAASAGRSAMLAPSQRHLSLLASSSSTFARSSSNNKQQLVVSSTMRSFSTSLAMCEKVQVPQMAESITEGTLKQWIKNKGDFVKEGEEIATIETDKIDVSVNAPISGTITETFSNEEDTVTVGKDLCNIEPGEAPAEGSSSGGGADKKDESSSSSKKDEGKKEEKNDTAEKKQEQPKKEEPKPKPQSSSSQQQEKPAAKKEEKKPSSSSASSSASAESSSPAPGSRNERRVKMSRMRVRIAERLKQSQNTAASLTTFNEIDMSSLIAFRARHKDSILKNEGVKLGFMSAFAKASAMALKEIPAANGTIEGEGLGDTIVYRDYVDLSVAVSTEKGLVTPVVRNLETMSLIQIEREIAALGKKARDNKLTIEDMSGGTFTISNGGVFGSLFGTPILNLPGSAILGMHAVKDKAWVVDGKVEVRPIMVVALTYDHRLLDGREAVTFLVRLKQYIEDMPSMLL